MIRIEECKLDLNFTEDDLTERICKILRVKKDAILSIEVVRKAIDARKKPNLTYVLTVDVQVRKEKSVVLHADKAHVKVMEPIRYHFPKCSAPKQFVRPVVIGSGPCGLLCTYELALHGFRPILLERGSEVDKRCAMLQHFFSKGDLDPNNNAQFGEGGAGAFSDGKLTTSVKDPSGRGREVLKLFVQMGADPRILSDAKPHLGTDTLVTILKNLRARIIELGGTVRFDSCVTDLVVKDQKITGVYVNGETLIETETVVLAIGHSARDTIRMLRSKELVMEAKPFAVGFRIEHPQEMIDLQQYGISDHSMIGAATYKLTAQVNGRGIYSFCMCPGGYVINASSEFERLCVNGMSYSGRDGANANSAIVVAVRPEEVGAGDPLSFLTFQESLEEKAYRLVNGAIPQQLYEDFKEDRATKAYGDYISTTKGACAFSNMRRLLPEAITDAFLSGMEQFGRQIRGFDRPDAILSGIESRTSSPVRIPRDDTGVSSIDGLYPAGEGAGYAGGIMSAAIDGIRAAERLALRLAGKTAE